MAVVLLVPACGGSSPRATGQPESPTTIGAEQQTTQPSLAAPTTTSPATTAATTPSQTVRTTIATQTTVATQTTLAPPVQATGLIHGTLERDCSGISASGGGCFNQSGGVAGATIEVRTVGGTMVGSARTDAAGVFEVRILAGRYIIKDPASGVFQERDVVAGRTTFVGLVLPAV